MMCFGFFWKTSQMLGPRPSTSSEPSIWKADVAAPHLKSVGNFRDAGCWSRAPCGPHAAVAANVLPASYGARALRVTPSLFICGPHFPFCRGNDDISYWAREACKHAMRKGQSRQAIESRAYEADFRHKQAKGRRDGAGPFFAPAVPGAVVPAGVQLPNLNRSDSH